MFVSGRVYVMPLGIKKPMLAPLHGRLAKRASDSLPSTVMPYEALTKPYVARCVGYPGLGTQVLLSKLELLKQGQGRDLWLQRVPWLYTNKQSWPHSLSCSLWLIVNPNMPLKVLRRIGREALVQQHC